MKFFRMIFAAILVTFSYGTISHAQMGGDSETAVADFLIAVEAAEDASDAGHAVLNGSYQNVFRTTDLCNRAFHGFAAGLSMSGDLEEKIDQAVGTAMAGLDFWSLGWGGLEFCHADLELAAGHMEWEEWEDSSEDSWEAELDAEAAGGDHSAADGEFTILDFWNDELESVLDSGGF